MRHPPRKNTVTVACILALLLVFGSPLLLRQSLARTAKRVYAQAKIDGLTGDWKTFKLSLTANAADPKSRLAITATRPGTIWLDVVSLFPKNTWKERPNGMRPDLAQMLADLRPSFVRFLGGWSNTKPKHAIERDAVAGKETPGQIETGRWYDIRVELAGQRIRCCLDGKLVHEAILSGAQPLYAVASRANAAGEVILKVVNVTSTAQDTELDLRGVPEVHPEARAVVLTSADPADENSLDAPTKVAPATRIVENAASKFRYTFPAQSVTILRLKTRR